MKFPVEEILNLPEMKVLDCQEVEGIGIVITIDLNADFTWVRNFRCKRSESLCVKA
jgi:hypothetical protein